MPTTHTLLLRPTDVLFFSDGRPMTGALTGHTATWPAPHIVNTALHAALHRAGIAAHRHRPARSGKIFSEDREKHGRLFGSLLTAGPFPVSLDGHWYFPTPADLVKTGPTIQIGAVPVSIESGSSSLPAPLTHALGATTPPAKDNHPSAWLRGDAWDDYLAKKNIEEKHFAKDADIADTEHQIGIGISADTQTQDGESFYSAQYLRLQPDWKLGVHAQADDKDAGDLIANLFPDEHHIIIGGQQRICTVGTVPTKNVLPKGYQHAEQFKAADGKYHVKWVLLTPAIFPELPNHDGGWLPNWIDPKTGALLLPAPNAELERRPGEPRDKWRERIKPLKSQTISAKLVAALVGKPHPVTGWSLGSTPGGSAGAKPVQLAVPAGSIYYFTCENAAAAGQLAAVLNWHGANANTITIQNRRSTLLGEKGYGLGICGTW